LPLPKRAKADLKRVLSRCLRQHPFILHYAFFQFIDISAFSISIPSRGMGKFWSKIGFSH